MASTKRILLEAGRFIEETITTTDLGAQADALLEAVNGLCSEFVLDIPKVLQYSRGISMPSSVNFILSVDPVDGKRTRWVLKIPAMEAPSLYEARDKNGTPVDYTKHPEIIAYWSPLWGDSDSPTSAQKHMSRFMPVKDLYLVVTTTNNQRNSEVSCSQCYLLWFPDLAKAPRGFCFPNVHGDGSICLGSAFSDEIVPSDRVSHLSMFKAVAKYFLASRPFHDLWDRDLEPLWRLSPDTLTFMNQEFLTNNTGLITADTALKDMEPTLARAVAAAGRRSSTLLFSDALTSIAKATALRHQNTTKEGAKETLDLCVLKTS